MRLLFVEPGGRRLGGAERSLAGLTAGLVDRGHHVTVLTHPGASAIPMFAEAGAEVSTTETLGRLVAGTRHGSNSNFLLHGASVLPEAMSASRAIALEARRCSADLVHSNGFRTHVLAPLLRAQGCTVSWALRDFAPRRLQRRLLRGASGGVRLVLANSEFTAAQLPHVHDRVRVVGNPVELAGLPNRESARRSLHVDATAKVIAVVGHLHPSKGQHVAIQAVQALRKTPQFANVELVLAGDAPYGVESQEYLQKLTMNVGGGIQILGAISDIERVYSAVDLVVQPSIHPEGFGRSVVEAQLAGVPVIATAIGGACELIEHDRNGALVAADDVEALRDAMEHVLGDDEYSAELVSNGASSARRFAPDAHIDAVEQAFLELAHT